MRAVGHIGGAGTTFLATAGASLEIESVLISGNSGDGLAEALDGAQVVLGFTTAVANPLGGAPALRAEGAGTRIGVYTSALLDGRIFAPPTGGTQVVADCVAGLDLTDFPAPLRPGSYLQVTSADQVLHRADGSRADLRVDSPAVDFCDATIYAPSSPDLEGDARPDDSPPAGSTRFGVYDLGADESRAVLFADHEEGDCSDWSSGACS